MRDLIRDLFSPAAMKKFRSLTGGPAEAQPGEGEGVPDLPPIPAGLIRALNKAFPDRVPHPGDTDRAIWMAVGAREVVRRIEEWAATQRPKPPTP